MRTLYEGKTKIVMLDETTNDRFLFFKDDATGENGVFDPGFNTVGGSVEGKGKTGLAISRYFFELMQANGIPTHYLGADMDRNLMRVRDVTVPALEFVMRYYTAGSMCRRFSIDKGIPFDPPYLEVTLKDDEQGDPLISERLCLMKGLLKEGEYDRMLKILGRVGDVLSAELKRFGLTLIDFKIEFGLDDNRDIYVADEITPDIWRVQNSSGNIPDQIECAKMIIGMIGA